MAGTGIFSAQFAINVGFHVLILTIFLVSFFYLYISKLTSEHIQSAIEDVVDDQIPALLDKVKASDTNGLIKWNIVAESANKFKQFYKEKDLYTECNNKKILIYATAFILIYLVALTLVSIMYRKDVDIKVILIENAVIFTCIGILEFLFFTKIAAKIIPVFPNDLAQAVKDRLVNKVRV